MGTRYGVYWAEYTIRRAIGDRAASPACARDIVLAWLPMTMRRSDSCSEYTPFNACSSAGISFEDVRSIVVHGEAIERYSTEAPVTCVICKKGEVVEGTTTVTLERGNTTVVIKSVPAGVCANCGEQYVDETTTQRLMTIADAAARTGVEVEVRQFAAA